MIQQFDSDVAMECGIKPAILFNNICFWVDHNEKNDNNFFEGTYWTYNSAKAFEEQFPYMSKKEIVNALKNLKDLGYIMSGNFSQNPYDRTMWYGLTEKGRLHSPCLQKGYIDSDKRDISICPQGQIDLPVGENVHLPVGENVYINNNNNQFYTDTLTDKKPDILRTSSPKCEKIVEKHRYGEFSHVLLTDDEHQKLVDKFGDSDTDGMIKFLDEAIEMHGYKYKSHYMVIAKEGNWVRNEYFKSKPQKPKGIVWD